MINIYETMEEYNFCDDALKDFILYVTNNFLSNLEEDKHYQWISDKHIVFSIENVLDENDMEQELSDLIDDVMSEEILFRTCQDEENEMLEY